MKILEYLFYHHFDVLGTIIIGVTVRLFEKSKLEARYKNIIKQMAERISQSENN